MRRLSATSQMLGSQQILPLRRQPPTPLKVPQRKRPRSIAERVALRSAVIGSAASLGLGLGYWLVESGWGDYLAGAGERAFLAMSASSGFTLTDVAIEGRAETRKDEILAAISASKGDPIFALDLEALRARLVDLPWVTAATAERRLPHELRITVREAVPMALWQRKGRFFLVGTDGEVIAVDDVGRFAELPVIVGEAAPLEAQALFAMLDSAPELRARVQAAVLVGGRRWNLRMDNGIDVKLPEDSPAAAWARLSALEKEHALLEKDITIIDLRLPDRLVLRQVPLVEPETSEDAEKSNET